jgi:hypothetical protein
MGNYKRDSFTNDQMNAKLEEILDDGENLPLRVKGEFEGYSWEFRGDIVGDSAREWTQVRGPNGGGGGGSVGALPFADLGWKVLGHIGSFGWSSGGWSRKGLMRRAYHPGTLSGVVSASVSRVRVSFKDGEEIDAQLLDSGQEEVRSFFLIHAAKRDWAHVVALDSDGQELDRVEHEDLPRKLRFGGKWGLIRRRCLTSRRL